MMYNTRYYMPNPKERLTQQEKESPQRLQFYRGVLGNLQQHTIPYGIIGGHAQAFYSKGREHTADLDIAIPDQQVGRTLGILATPPGRRIEYKHPDWLNQVWAPNPQNPQEEFSVDIIHGHSTGLVKVQPWWVERGVDGKYLGADYHFAAPEAFVLTKTLLWARRAHDMIDAVQVTYGSNKIRPFDWQLLIDNLGPKREDWRLAYSLAVLTEVLYGKESTRVLPKEIKQELHNFLTPNQIASPVRGHIFAYDVENGGIDAGKEESWKTGAIAIPLPPEKVVPAVLNDIQNWTKNPRAIAEASRKIVGQQGKFDWDSLINELGDNWRMALYTLLSTEILFGQTGSAIIPESVRQSLSQRFLQEDPGEEQGTKLFPHRNWHRI